MKPVIQTLVTQAFKTAGGITENLVGAMADMAAAVRHSGERRAQAVEKLAGAVERLATR